LKTTDFGGLKADHIEADAGFKILQEESDGSILL
jgi:hypothetical protein